MQRDQAHAAPFRAEPALEPPRVGRGGRVIELPAQIAEIEAALRTLPEVADACVVARPSDRWGQEVAAMLVLRPDTSLTLEALRVALADRLATFKLPRALLLVHALPQTATSKVDRRAVADAFAAAPKQT